MTKTILPASVFPDVLIVGGVTYVALPLVSGGLEVWRSDGPPVVFPSGTWPRLFLHRDGLLVAYKLSPSDPVPNTLAVGNVTTALATGDVTKALVKTGVQAFWNSPICWRDDGYLCVQGSNLPIEVWGAMWPAIPAAPAIRQSDGNGIAQWLDGALRTWNELGEGLQPVYLTGASVAQASIGGVQATLGAATGIIDPEMYTNNPRPALDAHGLLTFVYWGQDGHGATGTVLYQGVSAADLQPVPVTPPDPTKPPIPPEPIQPPIQPPIPPTPTSHGFAMRKKLLQP